MTYQSPGHSRMAALTDALTSSNVDLAATSHDWKIAQKERDERLETLRLALQEHRGANECYKLEEDLAASETRFRAKDSAKRKKQDQVKKFRQRIIDLAIEITGADGKLGFDNKPVADAWSFVQIADLTGEMFAGAFAGIATVGDFLRLMNDGDIDKMVKEGAMTKDHRKYLIALVREFLDTRGVAHNLPDVKPPKDVLALEDVKTPKAENAEPAEDPDGEPGDAKPDDDDGPQFPCPNCKAVNSAEDVQPNGQVKCWDCGLKFPVSGAPQSAAPAPKAPNPDSVPLAKTGRQAGKKKSPKKKAPGGKKKPRSKRA